ncbi:putative amidoligase enzyme-domain-containing protein [Annulohypoxylon moriforme]|nr:putative amidoligase enzyme-domain-containing protein [Annulohypoxylon moriforme]
MDLVHPHSSEDNPSQEDAPMATQLITKYDKIIESPDDSKGALTFGIELEFLVPFLKRGECDPFPHEKRPLFKFENYFEADALILNVLENACDLPLRHEISDQYRSPHHSVVLYDAWRLVKDSSVRFQKSDWKYYTWAGREITSVVMGSDDPKAYTEKITKICRAIRQLRVHLNLATSVHVHVGLGDEPFSLLTIKKFITLILLVDDMLMGLHHPKRRESRYCYLVSRCSAVSKLEPNRSKDYDDLMKRSLEQRMGEFIPEGPMTKQALQATKSIQELAFMMDDPDNIGYYRGSVSFARFLPEEGVGGNTQTIEFRQMAGCLDPDQIIHWVKVCVALVDFARLADAERYKSLLEKLMAKKSTFSAFDLLLELGLGEEEKHFRAQVKGYESNLDFYPGESSGKQTPINYHTLLLEKMGKKRRAHTYPGMLRNVWTHMDNALQSLDKREDHLNYTTNIGLKNEQDDEQREVMRSIEEKIEDILEIVVEALRRYEEQQPFNRATLGQGKNAKQSTPDTKKPCPDEHVSVSSQSPETSNEVTPDSSPPTSSSELKPDEADNGQSYITKAQTGTAQNAINFCGPVMVHSPIFRKGYQLGVNQNVGLAWQESFLSWIWF